MALLYFEDIFVGQKMFVGQYRTDKKEILEFAQKWDRQPFHIDDQAAQRSPYGGIIAPTAYILAVVTKISTTVSEVPQIAVIGQLGFDEMRIPTPVRPGDLLSLRWEIIEKRDSKSKPDRGIVRNHASMTNQHNEVVLTYIGTTMVQKRAM